MSTEFLDGPSASNSSNSAGGSAPLIGDSKAGTVPHVLAPALARRTGVRTNRIASGGPRPVHAPQPGHTGAPIQLRRRVLVCHHQRLIAEALAATLRAHMPRIDIVVETSLDALLRQLHQRTDVVVLGADADAEHAFEFIEAITHRRQQVPVLLLRSSLSVDEVARDLERGVIGVVSIGCTPAEMVSAVSAAIRREPALPPDLTAAVLTQLHRRFTRRSAAVSTLQMMSVREREVLVALVAGKRRFEIAEQMGVSHHTVRTHIHRVLSKLGVSSQLEAAAVGRRLLSDLDPAQLALVGSSDFNRWDATAN